MNIWAVGDNWRTQRKTLDQESNQQTIDLSVKEGALTTFSTVCLKMYSPSAFVLTQLKFCVLLCCSADNSHHVRALYNGFYCIFFFHALHCRVIGGHLWLSRCGCISRDSWCNYMGQALCPNQKSFHQRLQDDALMLQTMYKMKCLVLLWLEGHPFQT